MLRTFLAALACTVLSGQAPLPRGVLLPSVPCQADPGHSYALYLPSGYREDRAWPVLFSFSPGGTGTDPVERFREAAERSGWIVVGSNDSRNGPPGPALRAQDALWKDVHARFRVDPRRSYATGFSGGARMALQLALKHPKAIAGLVSIGAFWADPGRTLRDLGHLEFVLCCGLEDVAHFELVQGRQELKARGWKALSIRFDGGHEWPPAAVCGEALEALDLGAMERGWLPADPGRAGAFRARRAASAEAAEAQGAKLLALRQWEDLALRFADPEAGRRAARLSAAPEVRQELDLEAAAETQRETLARLLSTQQYGPELGRLHDRLRQAPPAERLMLRRVLGGEVLNLRLAAAAAIERREWPRAEAILLAIADLDERQPRHRVALAGVLLQQGRTGAALLALRRALREGYRDLPRLREHPLLEGLRGHPEFERLLRELETAPPPASG